MSGALPVWVTPATIAVVFTVLFIAETLAPLRRQVEPRLRRMARNFTTGGISLAVVTLLQTPILLPIARFVEREQFGVVHWLRLERPWSIVVAVVLLDYALWVWHWANHRVPFLWRFHLTHHIDRDMDTSTAFRFHFGEMAMSVVARAIKIAIIGAEPLAVAVWQVIVFVSILFHHSNARLPRRLESVLVRFIVTPRMHGIHHSAREDETHSNWSTILTVWDFLHRTFRFDVPDEKIVIGIPAYQDPRDVTIGKVLTLPFRKQRDDWSG